MSPSDTITTIAGGGLGLLILVMSLIQIAPIKIDPWSYLLRKLGKTMNEEITEKVDELETKLENLQISCNERAMTDCRSRFLRFNDEILHKTAHTKEHFDQILLDISDYESYCSSHPNFKNNIASLAIKNIKSTYVECERKGTFL